jgi:hypothetical protein
MTMHFRDLADKAAVDGEVSIDEVLGLRRDGWGNGLIDESEIGAIFDLNDHLKDRSPEWVDFFVETVATYLIDNGQPKGYVRQSDAEALIARIDADGRVESMAELRLLEKICDRATALPDCLKAYALAQIEQAVMTGTGPTRNGEELAAKMINAEECRLLRSFIFAAGGDRPAAVSKSEAAMLFRIKDASLGAENAPEWKQLFVQGVGNYLQGFACHEPLSAERAAELEAFMNDTAVNIGRFFSRMAETNPAEAQEAARAEMAENEDDLDFDEELNAAEEITSDEKAMLDQWINADGQVDEFEKALLDFIAEA